MRFRQQSKVKVGHKSPRGVAVTPLSRRCQGEEMNTFQCAFSQETFMHPRRDAGQNLPDIGTLNSTCLSDIQHYDDHYVTNGHARASSGHISERKR